MATSAAYAATPVHDLVQVTTANTTRDGSGALPTVATGTVAGKRIARVRVTATGTTTAGMIRFFLSIDSGTNKRLIAELSVAAITPSATVKAFMDVVPELAGLNLVTTAAILYASTHNGEIFNIHCESATY